MAQNLIKRTKKISTIVKKSAEFFYTYKYKIFN